MYTTTPLPSPDSVQLERVVKNSQGLVLEFTACRPAVPCPDCAQTTHRVHSHYVRHLADLPVQGKAVSVTLLSRKFFCDNPECKRRIFTERLPDLTERYSRRTGRLRQALHLISLVVGGRAGARLAQSLGIVVGRDSMIRGLKRWIGTVSTHRNPVRVLGIDDWALRKGQNYGTILCDLERHTVIDLLPDRNAQTAAQWLQQHPEIEVISRDRGGIYAEAGRIGAPQAIQVADRFHLLKNLNEMVQRTVEGRRAEVLALFAAPAQPLYETGSDRSPISNDQCAEIETSPARRQTRAQTISSQRRLRRQDRYEKAVALWKAGHSLTGIGRILHLDRKTVKKLVHASFCPQRAPRLGMPNVLDQYRGYLEKRWQEGCQSYTVLFHELQSQGFDGGLSSIWNYMRPWREQQEALKAKALPCATPPSPRQLSWLFLYPDQTLQQVKKRSGEKEAENQQTALGRLMEGDSELKVTVLSARRFAEIINARQAEQLDLWIAEAMASGARELARFARGITQDYAAVRAALELEFSNGQVEGQVNRLKMIKRQMYGRAGIALLKARAVTTN